MQQQCLICKVINPFLAKHLSLFAFFNSDWDHPIACVRPTDDGQHSKAIHHQSPESVDHREDEQKAWLSPAGLSHRASVLVLWEKSVLRCGLHDDAIQFVLKEVTIKWGKNFNKNFNLNFWNLEPMDDIVPRFIQILSECPCLIVERFGKFPIFFSKFVSYRIHYLDYSLKTKEPTKGKINRRRKIEKNNIQ